MALNKPKSQNSRKIPNFIFCKLIMVPCKSTVEEVLFEWSHHRISSTDSKVRTTLHVSIIDSGSIRTDYSCSRLARACLLKENYFVSCSIYSIVWLFLCIIILDWYCLLTL